MDTVVDRIHSFAVHTCAPNSSRLLPTLPAQPTPQPTLLRTRRTVQDSSNARAIALPPGGGRAEVVDRAKGAEVPRGVERD